MKQTKHSNQKNSGFTLLETMIVLAIMTVILAIIIFSYNSAQSKKKVEVTIDSISLRLEEAKSNALAGKKGTDWGVKFNTIGYVLFNGSSFNSADVNNASSTVATNITIKTNLSGGGSSVIFSRMTGVPNVTGSVVINDINNIKNLATTTIGTLGDISVLK